MNPNSPLTIYAMVGPMGSGKTTLAMKIAREEGAPFQSLDGTIKAFNQPIGDLRGYESLMPKALELMFSKALEALKTGQSVVFDVGRWTWLRELADAADAKIEIYYFEISSEERWRRVQKRNEEKPEGVFHWTMSKEDFDAQDSLCQLPPETPGLKLIKISALGETISK
jgi:predicted kinase